MSSTQNSGSSESTNNASSKSLGLQRRLLQVAVVVGMDEDKGLQYKYADHNLNVDDKGLFENHYKPHLLDILSGPQDLSNISMFVPSTNKSKTLRDRISVRRTGNVRKTVTLKKVGRNRSVRKLKNSANRGEEVPVSTDFLSNLPSVCLPNDSKVSPVPVKPGIHLTVLTNVNGVRHYAVILRLYRAFTAVKNNPHAKSAWSLLSYDTSERSSSSEDDNRQCYVPLCICLISGLPYLDVLKGALSCLGRDWEKSTSYDDFEAKLKKFVTNLSVIPFPPPGIRVNFVLSGYPFAMYPPRETSRQNIVVDIDLSVPILAFMNNYETLIKILSAILLEQRLVFVSENSTFIVIVMEALLQYIFPFYWPHPYIPTLFTDKIEFVACPGIFMMGCHVAHKSQITKIENDQILIDLDSGEYIVCPSFESTSKAENRGKLDLCIPDHVSKSVIKRLSELRLFDHDHLQYPSAVTMEDLAREKLTKRQKLNRSIETIFIDMMVDLFSNAVHFIDHEVSQFHSDDFLKASSKSDRPFYEKVVKTYMFRKFVKERRKGASDMFSKIAESKRIQDEKIEHSRSFYENLRRRSAGESFSPSLNREESSRSSKKLLNLNGFSRNNATANESIRKRYDSATVLERAFDDDDFLTMSLPSFPEPGTNFNTTLFYSRCLSAINVLMESAQTRRRSSSLNDHLFHSTFRASCLVLRGIYSIVSGDVVQGLQDLHETAKEDLRVFPLNTIKTVVGSLSPDELAQVSRQSFYKGDRYYETAEGTPRHDHVHYDDDDVPCRDLDFDLFSSIVQRRAISNDKYIITTLFNALSTARSPRSDPDNVTVDHDAFEVFCNTWKQRIEECERFRANIVAADTTAFDFFRDSEAVLKWSDLVSSNKGTGRLILTNERLLFMSESLEDYKFESRLTQLKNVKVTKQKILLRNVNVLLFQTGNEVSFRVNLKTECEFWKMILEEMRSGRILAKNLKDHLTTSDIAAQNVRIINVLYEAATDGELMDVDNAMNCSKQLCKHTQQYDAGNFPSKLPPETAEMLLLKIDLSPMETNKSPVNTILYSSNNGSDDPHDLLCVWIALASSKIRLVATRTWSLDSRSITDFNVNLLSLCNVGRELWVGASDKSIYVIQCATLQQTQVLHDHSAPVVSVFNFNKKVASASTSGEIIFWDKELKKKTSRFEISSTNNQLVSASKLNNETICCCLRSTICLYSSHGECLQSLSIVDFEFGATCNEIICCVVIHTSRENQHLEIWAGDSAGFVYVWHHKHSGGSSAALGDRYNRFVPFKRSAFSNDATAVAVTCIMPAYDGRVWIGNSIGDIAILHQNSLDQEKLLKAHDDAVTCLCRVENRCVISGSKSNNGKIYLWRFETI